MSKRSVSGSALPPTAGVVSDELLDARTDLRQYAGWVVHVPRTVDIASAMESTKVARKGTDPRLRGFAGGKLDGRAL